LDDWILVNKSLSILQACALSFCYPDCSRYLIVLRQSLSRHHFVV
jgi:hypothetical protein